jgi:hypothetical protein
VAKRSAKLTPLATPAWTHQVRDQLVQQADPGAATRLSVEDCAELAALAGRLLRGEPLPTRGMIQRFILGASLPELVARSLLDTLALPQGQSPVAAARALQATGIAPCREAGLALTTCPCLEEPAGLEFESVLFLLFRLALAHWTGLVIPFQPLASP